MKKITIAGFGLVAASRILFAQGQDAAIKDVVAQYLDARNHADEAKTRALFTSDADQLVSSGEWRRGRDNLVKGAMASSQKEGGNSVITIDAVRFVTKDVAIADGDYETHAAGTGQARKMRTTFVLKHEQAGWKISAIRNMLPAPAANRPSAGH